MKLSNLIFIILILQIGQLHGQSEGFEKDLNVFSYSGLDGFITGGVEHNNSIYANFLIECDPLNSNCFTEFHKYDIKGDLVWSYKLDSLLASFKSFTIGNDKVYVLAKRHTPTNSHYFSLVTIDTLGNLLDQKPIKLNQDYYQSQVVTNINLINELLYITGFGYDPSKGRFLGYVRVIDESGEDIYFNQWDQIQLGYRRTIIWEIFEKEGIDSLVYFTAVEDDGPVSDFLPTDRHCLYSLNISENKIDTIFHTNNRQTPGLHRSLIDFNNIGNIIFTDSNSETISTTGIEVGEIQDGFIDYDGALWITRIRDVDFQEEHNILGFSYNALDILLSRNDDIYICGILDWSRFDEEIWWDSTCFIAKFSATGEFLWQKIYVEIGDGILNNKSQYIYSLNEMEDESLIGVGLTGETFSNSISRNGWMIKLNEYGCIDGSADCPFINFLDSTTTTQNIKYESISLEAYPNPAQNSFEVQFQEPVSGTLKLYNLTGSFIEEFEIKNLIHFQIATNNLKSGAYSLIFISENNPSSIMSTNIVISN